MTSIPLTSTDSDLILIVDDTPANLAVISETLSDAGFEIAIAISGERALEQIGRELPDLILLDVMMPGMGGFELCRRLQADEQFQQIPIIFMTANTNVDSKVEGFQLGAVDYITKPFEEREVVARVNTHLELKRTRCQLQQSQARLSSILGSIKEIIWSAYLNPFELIYINPAVEEIFGQPEAFFLADSGRWLNMSHPADRPAIVEALSNPKPGQTLDLEYRILTDNGDVRWLQCQAKIHWHPVENRFRIDGVARDISDHKRVEQQLRHSAQHDSLTNLANRAYFTQRLNQLLEGPRQRRRDLCALLFIDLDRFKSINDTLGHAVGDQLLVHVSEILQRSIREYDLVARMGGDEFTILLTNLGEASEATLVSNRIQSRLQQPLLIQDQAISITASIGIVVDFSPYKTAKELLHHADLAMYQAKDLGKACHQLFESKFYEKSVAKQSLERDLRDAIEQQDLMLVYQPIRTAKTDQLKGFEALMRWRHPEQGMIPPSIFIPLAEETGLIIPLGERLVQLACEQIRDWQTRFPTMPKITINLNISGRQLQHPSFVEVLDQTLDHYQISPACFELEITESSLMEKNDRLLPVLQGLRQRGFRLSLDDFGTGYSSLSYLHRFPIDTLKIDRSFVQTMEPDSNSIEIIRTILALAKTLHLMVVAEGVETAEQADVLKELDCDMVQGYFFARPLNPDAATEYLLQALPVSSTVQTIAEA